MSKIVLLMSVLVLGFGCGEAPKKSGSGNNGNNGSGNNGNNGSSNNGSSNNGINNGVSNNGVSNNGVSNNGSNNGTNSATEYCHNANDEEIIWNSDTETPATECAFGCLDGGIDRTCHSDCLSESTGLTENCSLCYTDVVECVLANCTLCIEDFTSFECTSCQTEAGCDDAFEACAGIPRN